MTTQVQTPGVYVQEVDKGTKPIEAVGASVAAFIGMTVKASTELTDPQTGDVILSESVLNKPIKITSWSQYKQIYGDLSPYLYTPDAVYGHFHNGGGTCYIVSVAASGVINETPSINIPAAEGEAVSFVVTASRRMELGDKISIKIATAKGKVGFSLTVDDETHEELTAASLAEQADPKGVVRGLFKKVDISAIGTAEPKAGTYTLTQTTLPLLQASDIRGDEAERIGLAGLYAYEDIKLVLCPDAMVGYKDSKAHQERVRAIHSELIAHCERIQYCFAVLDAPPGLSPQAVEQWRKDFPTSSSRAAMYYPWIRIEDASGGQGTKLVPPSGHVVGVYNRVDNTRGVHKAPANENILGALGLEIDLSKRDQESLNPIGVNCIRFFPGRGIRIWGARTLSDDPSWRYINVRRLFIVVGDSLDRGLQWVVFEPNDRTLWGKVRRDIRSFLRTLWLGGAFFGSTPDEAFYVKCDDELNPLATRDLGQLIIEVGIAPVKPAEFVIVRLSQWAGPNAEA